ncbi:valine--tRNA ligase [Porphyromonas endodontalis]|uniref:valine--tRNA ligase n=2 Tax=Porphyromonas endodontalis TaxID=28124 RepID=UPI003619E8E8
MNNETVYNPSEIESKWYQYWLEQKHFASSPDEREPYTVVIPPPNVTGVLHMGHMLNNTIQDVLVRRARLLGYNACWVPGTDHASIATEAKVVARLAEQGIDKRSLMRETFLKHAWDWTHEHGGIILEQLKRLGASCDWDRTAFTLDEDRSRSVIKVFCDLYESGLIYRGVRIVNWDPKAQTALSDEEVIYREEHSKLYYLRYNIEGSDDFLTIATTRPETIMGDTAVCVHPEDPRYQQYIGKHAIIPIVGRSIPIIADEYVDREFGTGCLKVTPAHDINDYNLGQKHNLETIDIFNDNGTLNEKGGAYAGMDRFDVRRKIAQDLQTAGLLIKEEDYTNKVGCSERTQVPIEPKLSMQWFLKMEELAGPALEAVEKDEVRLIPAKFKNTYRHWMENVKDWCISRQLWWGHRIPAYYLPQGGFVVAPTPEEALEKAKKETGCPSLTLADLREEEDCLDTWFSSWLWPITVFGDIDDKDNKELNYYYPIAVLVTAPDILFFWVARMIIAGYRYRGQRPFRDVYLTGIVRDAQGRKMSKSLGNSPDPLNLIEKYGADGVRVGMMMATSAGNDLLYDESLLEQGRNFCNKIWNSYRLISNWQADASAKPGEANLLAVEWFHHRLAEALLEIDDLMSKYRISEAMTVAYKLYRDDFSAFYLEAIKPPFGAPMDAQTLAATHHYLEVLLQTLHPFMPFITEELWQDMAPRKAGETIMYTRMPKLEEPNKELLATVAAAREVITQVRNVRTTHNIARTESLTLQCGKGHPAMADCLISKLAGATCTPLASSTEGGSSATFIVGTVSYTIPIDSYIDKGALREKLEADLKHQQGFLMGVRKKLSNERFVSGAPQAVVDLERKKEADALARIATLEKQLKDLE